MSEEVGDYDGKVQRGEEAGCEEAEEYDCKDHPRVGQYEASALTQEMVVKRTQQSSCSIHTQTLYYFTWPVHITD